MFTPPGCAGVLVKIIHFNFLYGGVNLYFMTSEEIKSRGDLRVTVRPRTQRMRVNCQVVSPTWGSKIHYYHRLLLTKIEKKRKYVVNFYVVYYFFIYGKKKTSVDIKKNKCQNIPPKCDVYLRCTNQHLGTGSIQISRYLTRRGAQFFRLVNINYN